MTVSSAGVAGPGLADGGGASPASQQNEVSPSSSSRALAGASASACARKPPASVVGASGTASALRHKGQSVAGAGGKPTGASPLSDGKREGKGNGFVPCVEVPECVREVCPELYRESAALGELQREMDESVEQLVTSLRDTCYPCLQTSSRIVLPTLLSRRRLRVFIYNTHENQPPPYSAFDMHAPQPDRLAAALSAATLANAQSAGGEVAGAPGERVAAHAASGFPGEEGKKNACVGPVETSDVHTPPPSWCLYIKAVSMEKQDNAGSNSAGGPGASVFTPRFSSFFSRVMILTPEESVVWDSRTTSSLAASLFDGLSIQRKGSREMPLKILFFINYRTPTFRLSDALSTLCGGRQQLSLCGILRAVWAHVMANNLLVPAEEKGEKAKTEKDPNPSKAAAASEGSATKAGTTTVDPRGILYARTDAALQAVFGAHVEQFCFADLPRLLRSQLLPPRPVCISHPLKLSGDWIDNEQAYDFTLECLDTAGAGWSVGGPGAPHAGCGSLSALTATSALWSCAVETMLQNMTTSCCVLGLDPWLSSQHQVLQQLATQTQHLQLVSAASQAPGAAQAPGSAQRRGKGEQTEDEQHLLQDILRMQRQSDDIDAKLKQAMEKLQQRVMYLNLYKGFAKDPLAFLNQQLSPTLPDISEALLDEDFVYDYHTRQRTAAYYTSPWVPRAVQRYLQKRNVPYEDQVCKVLSSFNIPDPRKRQRENAEGAPAAPSSGAGSSGAASRSAKPRAGTNPATGGASSSQRPRPAGASRHVKKKEEAPAPTQNSASPLAFSSGASAPQTNFAPGAAASGGAAGASFDASQIPNPVGPSGVDHPPLGVSGDPGAPGGSGFAPHGGMKTPAPGAHFGPSPSFSPVDPSVAMMGVAAGGPRPAGPYQAVGRMEPGRRSPMMAAPGVYAPPVGMPMHQMMAPHGLMAGQGGMGTSWPAGAQAQGLPAHLGPGQFWSGGPGMHPGAPGAGMRQGGHMG
ncbi:RSC6/BAF60A ortholog with a SWIB domain, related [Neospora caninum Liverpool]|uniref:RSC6/BAF60A ortholog with a SWIB domain, related n=1 Tax=Neospora caninum (strain Liverpool) TaxID=572307 RepID=F0VQI8_NEOCL|nr:RSC6/BAF60A ortholog with a SWIB domain, related [Neospora caninum Liverpool]CBZ55985.1 RSC6/BAF60A ortholog with a SWIB domain, related [Neospora caninum Liverpool]CEL70731.1 TPA: RSC6/BAF60A ortholog with a SWIB domain, related [Neospora caninum Liverpool]|eukprot:XP_003886011.1 RSC6/BAF60A ortholog with a SWIB domain, related [Neospora caninum Liverpool]